jgi:Protein kinase domain
MIYNPLSTKSKQALSDKQGSTKFFKKFSTD